MALLSGWAGRDAPFDTQQEQPSGAPTYLRRGFAADPARWNASSLPEYLTEADKNVFVCIMLETAEAVENIEEICAVPGLDSVCIGQMDLSGAHATRALSTIVASFVLASWPCRPDLAVVTGH